METNCTDLCRKVKELEEENRRIEEDALNKVNKCESKYQAILNTVDSHLSLVDRNFKIIWANVNARNLFGDDIIGKNCHEACQGNNNPCASLL